MRTSRIAHIDGLRAVAVLLVVAFHAAYHYPNPPRTIAFLSWRHLCFEGAHGVDLFFVLSGFCLSYPVLAKIKTSKHLSFDTVAYFAKRFVRIVPPYYLAIVIVTATGLSMTHAGAISLIKQFCFLDYRSTLVNGSFWTLPIEFRWYFFFPLALWLWTRSPRAFLAVALASSLAYNLTVFHNVADAAMLLPFMLGIVAAHLELNGVKERTWIVACLPAAVLLALAYEAYATAGMAFFTQTNVGWQITAFIAVVLCSYRPLRRVLSWKPLTLIGTSSYSIYLIHEPIVARIEALHQAGPLLAPIAFGVSVCAGIVLWFLWERAWTGGSLRNHAVALLVALISRVSMVLNMSPKMALRVPIDSFCVPLRSGLVPSELAQSVR